MEKFKTNNSSIIKLLLLLGIILAIVLPFMLIIKPTLEKSKELDKRTAELEERVSKLTSLKEQYGSLNEDIQNVSDLKNEVMDKYSNGLRQSNTVAFLMDAEEKFGLPVKAESFESYVETPISDGHIDEEGNLTGDIKGLSTTVSVSFEGDYTACKDFLNYINTYKEKMTLYEVNMDYDDVTGLVGGDVKLNQYAFVGTDRGELSKPKVKDIKRGTKCIFNPDYTNEIPTEETEETTEGDVAGAQ